MMLRAASVLYLYRARNGPAVTIPIGGSNHSYHEADSVRSMPKRLPVLKLLPKPVEPDSGEHELPRFRWAGPEVGFRHRLGGVAEFVDEEYYPGCDDCGKTMTFYGQLDSLSDEIILADAGVVMVFVCFGCFTAKALIGSS